MKAIFEELIRNIPDYKVFLTVDELDAHSFALAKQYPDIVSIFPFGKTKENRDLFCLKIGSGSQNALMFGCPHPNEPIGTMMLEYFSEQLAKNKALRDELDYTWYIVKVWDADGLRLNEGWLKGPYTIRNYSRNFFRPAGFKQVDWTFPIDYKGYHFDAAVPETEAMMKLIDEIQPHFIYSLHNAGFGGVYWYMSRPLPELYDDLYAAANREQVPLNLGEPEVPYCKPLAPAIYPNLGTEQEIDYLESYGAKEIDKILKVGNCSESYARTKYRSFTLLTELPYFYDPRIMQNDVPGTMTRRASAEVSLDMEAKSNAYLRSALEDMKDEISADNPFRLAVDAFSENRRDESTRKMIAENPEYNRTATVAEEFDNVLMSRFYKSLSYGMVIRMAEYELSRMQKVGEQDEKKEAHLKAWCKNAERQHSALMDTLEKELNYSVVPIRKLVSIQLACGLLVSDYLKDKNIV